MNMIVEDYKPIFNLFNKLTLNNDKGLSHVDGFIRASKELGIEYKKRNRFLFINNPNNPNLILGGVADMVPSTVTSMAIKLANDKNAMYHLLRNIGIPVPNQKVFSLDEYDEALNLYIKDNSYSVIKPSNGSGGRGITVGINGEDEFRNAWGYCIENIRANGQVLLEERVRGFDVRAIMIGDQFSCAVSRVPPYIVGNGMSSIDKLIQLKNIHRSKHPHHKRFPIDVSKFKVNVDEKLEDNQIYFLSNISNIHQGGEAIDITDYIGGNVKKYLAKIMKVIPGLNVAGIDLMMKDFDDIDSLKVIEINTSPNYEIHYTPYYGQGRNPAKDFVQSLL